MKKVDAATKKFMEVHCPHANFKPIKMKFYRLFDHKPSNKSSAQSKDTWPDLFFDTNSSTPSIPDDEKQKKGHLSICNSG